MQSFSTFIPPERTLMGPGPSDVNPRILNAMARPTLGHLDPLFIELMDQTKQLLQYAFKTENALTMPISAPGSAGMEACFVNLVEPGDKVLVCINGVFGNRMVENVERCGGEAITVNNTWGEQTDLNVVEDTLKANPDIKILAFVHAETSTGVRNSVEEVRALLNEDTIFIVDAVTSFGTIELNVDLWGIDAVFSCSQKGLSCPPGASPVSFSKKAMDKILNRQTKVPNFYLDMQQIIQYLGGEQRTYHHTAPINSMYAIYQALLDLENEGLDNTISRHLEAHKILIAGLEELGVKMLVDESCRLPSLNSVIIPGGVDDLEIRKKLIDDYDIEIGGGLGPLGGQIWRIGLMGYSAKQSNVDRLLSALKELL